MDLSITTALSDTPLEWGWPIQTGILKGSSFQPAQLQKYHWAQTLSKLHLIMPSLRPGRRLNLLLLNTQTDIARLLSQPATGIPSTDVVMVKMLPEFFKGKTSMSLMPMVTTLARATKAGGVFIYGTGLPDSKWYDQLIIELSHNHNIGKALGNVPNTGGFGFVSPGLAKATELETFIAKLSVAMVTGKVTLKQPINYNHHQRGYISTINGKELGNYFLNNIKILDYSGESQTASVIKEITDGMQVLPGKMITVQNPSGGIKKGVTTLPAAIKKFPMKGFGFTVNDVESFFSDKGSQIINLPGKNTTGTSSAKPNKNMTGEGAAPLPEKKNAAKPATNPTITPRYLQAAIHEKGKAKKQTAFLLPQTVYDIKVRIGEEEKELISTGVSIPTLTEIFADPTVKEATIDLLLYCNTMQKPMQEKIVLPRQGSSDFASFSVNTGARQKTFEGTIYAFHKDRLLQKVVLRSDIRTAEEKPVLKKITLTTEAVLRQDLTTLEDRPAFGMSMFLPEDEKKKQPVPAMAGGQSLDLQIDDGVRGVINSIQQYIDEVVTVAKQGKTKLNDPENVILLTKLANAGNMLYLQLLNKTDIKGDALQIVSKKRNYTPLEFVYSFTPPAAGAALCPNAAKALKKGACMNCFTEKSEWRKHVCPMGFWGLSRVIERHQYNTGATATPGTAEYTVKNEPVTGRKALKLLNRTLHAETEKVDESSAGMVKKIDDAITATATKANKAADWDKWIEMVEKTDPDSLILVVHLEDTTDTVGVSALEIGKEKLLPINHFDEDCINKRSDSHTPFLVLIGCETSNMQQQGFDAGSMAAGYGAAIVLSNFTRIQGKHAGEIVMRLMKLLKDNAGKELSFGEVILQLKQQLLAEGIMVVLTLLAYGDADWKIKT